MTIRLKHTRAGTNLIELLVVIAILTALAGLAVMMLPSIANTDMALKGTAEVQTTCKQAQSMAGARHPRGVRFLRNPNNPNVSTEMVLLESPVVMVPDREVLVAKPPKYDFNTNPPTLISPGDPTGLTSPYVDFVYELYNGTEAALPGSQWVGPGNPPAGTIKRRHCFITGLTAEQESQVTDGAVLVLPVLNAWSRIIGSPVQYPYSPPAPAVAPPRTIEVVLEVYPDAALGTAVYPDSVSRTARAHRTYYAAIYGPPVPLLGEPTIPLPRDIAVDLEVSYPPLNPTRPHYDIMFAPSGQTITTPDVAAGTTVFLWVRDYQKVTSMNPAAYGGYTPAYADAFRLAGEQQIVGIRNGFVGTAPVFWPNPNGTYGIVNGVQQDPFTLARSKLN
jgi:type II secretory pathway pseudopilin PulG